MLSYHHIDKTQFIIYRVSCMTHFDDSQSDDRYTAIRMYQRCYGKYRACRTNDSKCCGKWSSSHCFARTIRDDVYLPDTISKILQTRRTG
ncbi:hypothetical protein AR158_c103R [Paramecium bursaria Chlorella virus AR158]|uniref:hypothetical protein n=1 Tax=Paramecium bursaria Chlorella virus AR158 TaxID=380598 RepID=UPI00015AA7AD|nr:hypothetical protein AR158_c103R [Paramecium bursaria Chlorella virus AR158]ABU43649.1 hypothetical protein AR158_c103R [Paramecium bursaria Chlorella virus AR158]